jgi:hypothetical protein
MVFPFQLAHVFSVAFEEELSTEWNSASLVSFFAAAAVQNLRAGSAFILNGFIYIYTHAYSDDFALSPALTGMLLKTPELIENEQGLHTVTSSQVGR